MAKLDGLMRRLGYTRFEVIEVSLKREAKSALDELKDSIERAVSIVRLRDDVRKILSDAIGAIDTYSKMDIDAYNALPETLRAIDIAPITLRSNPEVTT